MSDDIPDIGRVQDAANADPVAYVLTLALVEQRRQAAALERIAVLLDSVVGPLGFEVRGGGL